MGESSNIQWTDHTFNPFRGCTKVSPGCANCYAARDSVRFPNIRGVWGDAGTRIVAVPSAWAAALKWNREGERRRVRELHSVPAGSAHDFKRARVFCASLADVFEDWGKFLHYPDKQSPSGLSVACWNGSELVRDDGSELAPATMANARQQLFRLIEATPHLDWQLLTKRPENVMRMVPDHWRVKFPDNVWMGTTAEDQKRANERIPELLKIPASTHFLSCEPLLGPVDLTAYYLQNRHGEYPFPHLASEHRTRRIDLIDWVICGGESGPKARPMEIQWARDLRRQCLSARVPFFMKQLGGTKSHRGELEDFPEDLRVREFPNGKGGQ